ncbi:hypothetical protein N7533_001795 [Penicillium manginii]|uniref:uncharacterized protein n=1 Tax=Penicillium manginii TaxID=203109 RepID=UPI0025490F2B|nr:uncharacterized protein N7533_001795 [Penicillium manginii]KAJ5763114.1 hypothetical protein N7533_001795 [Penicillium manginii]
MRAAHWSRCIQVLQENTACIYSVAWGPNGELASGSRDKMVRTWDPNTGKCLATLEGHEDTVVSVAWSKSGVLASGSIDGTIKIWDTAMRHCVATLKDGKSKVLSIDWSPGGVLLCSGCENGVIKIWDTAIGECKSSLKADIDNVGSVSWGRDGRLATFCHGVMRVWNPLTGECLSIISGCGEGIRSIAWSTDGRIGTGSNSHIPAVWSPRSELCLASFKGHEYSVTSVAWSSKGIFASGSLDETIKFWDPRTGRHIETIEGHGDSIMSIDWSEDGKLVSASSDGTIRLWDTTGIEDQPFLTWIFYRISFMIWSAFATFVWCIAQGQDRKKPISWTNYSTGMTHNPLTDRFEPIKIHKSDKTRMILASTFWAVLFFRSRSMITFGLYFMSIVTTCSILWKCRIVRIWVPHEGSGIFIRPIDGEQKSVTCLAWSPDNKLLASGSRDATVKIWNAKTGQCILTLEGHSSWARCVDWSPKRGLLASGSLDGTVRIWDPVSGECTKIIEVGEPVLDLSWSFDGNLLVTVSMTTKEGIKNTIRVWTKNTMECIFVLDDTDKDGVSFDLENPNLLHTSAGTFDIRSGHVVKHSSQFSTRPLFEESQYALNEDLSWVTRQGKKLIFLPLEYRSHIWCSNDTTVAVGCSSGEVLIMCLSTMNKFW